MKKTKQTQKITLGIIGSLILSGGLHGQLSVDQITDPINGCDGSLDITADGNAGPFTLQLMPLNNMDTVASSPNVQGSGSLSGLCDGEYEVVAVNRFGCSHSLGTVTLGSGASVVSDDIPSDYSKNGDKPKDEALTEFKVSYFPNPFAEDITIRIETFWDSQYNILITDMIGRKLYEKDVSVSAGSNDIVISELRQKSEGIYMTTITDKDGAVVKSFRLFKVGNGQDD